ncbi:hypothetical protein FOA52_010284 [Chlamydomonas sp. UWO 241]|nr:hypothetical protein FOA52_010284 [Chlamydomonas sp. UWO 241]
MLGVDPLLTGYSLMFGASASFISPYGYQPNLMVFQAGGMRFWDLAKVGIPFQVWMWVGATVVLGLHAHVMVVMGCAVAIALVVGLVLLAWLHRPCIVDTSRAVINRLRPPKVWLPKLGWWWPRGGTKYKAPDGGLTPQAVDGSGRAASPSRAPLHV